jgi:hypothetical protein
MVSPALMFEIAVAMDVYGEAYVPAPPPFVETYFTDARAEIKRIERQQKTNRKRLIRYLLTIICCIGCPYFFRKVIPALVMGGIL